MNICFCFPGQQAMVMLRLWLNTEGNRATGNALEKALKNCDREDIVRECIFNVELVTDESEQNNARSAIIRSGAGVTSPGAGGLARGKTPTIPEADDEDGQGGQAGFESFKEELSTLDAQHSSTLKRDEVVTTTMTSTTSEEKHASSAEERFTEKSATIVHQERTSE